MRPTVTSTQRQSQTFTGAFKRYHEAACTWGRVIMGEIGVYPAGAVRMSGGHGARLLLAAALFLATASSN